MNHPTHHETLSKMNYKTLNLKPLTCMSVSDKTLPLDIGLKVLLVESPTFGFLVFTETAIPIYGFSMLRAGFKFIS